LSKALALAACLSLSIAACRDRAGPARAEADRIWTERCVRCHGLNGRGDGPEARTLKTHPRDFHDAKWQEKEDDEELSTVIVLGGKALGHSEEMPPNPDLSGKQDVLRELVLKIREFGEH
jgi:mono/diheme cytochrome c family protein